MNAFSNKDAEGKYMPLVSRVISFIMLFFVLLNNIQVQATPNMNGCNLGIDKICTGGTITIEDEGGCIVVSNNPASDGVFGISAIGESAVITSITIVDLNNNVRFYGTYNNASVALDISGLDNGEYVISVVTSVCTFSGRLTVY